ncbi:MAG: CPBP family intramembrane metalloprotease [Lachnospiraceae bacterium]|nr:CPBP family intramembrane metalloprotease [Lachnospiraceae bacterium]
MEKKQKKQNVLTAVLAIYFICYGFRVFEYFILRTDKTWVGEAVVHKLTGIVILFAAVGFLRETLADIGLARKGRLRNIGKGLFFGIGVFIIAYAVEIMMAIAGGTFVSLQVYVSTYAVDQNLGHRTEWLFYIICIVGNMVNVFMEEGIFRGLFQKILEKKYSFMCSALIASILFGLWHIVGPIRNYFDGVSGVEGMIANAIMLTVTSALVGFKFALLTKMTGSLYMAMGDHFVNNTIVNILHVVSETGIDEMMFVRITIAQSVSFLLVLICYIRREHKRR